MILNYASEKPFLQMGILFAAVAFSMRYFIIGVEDGTNMFADVQDLAFRLHGMNATQVPELAVVRQHLLDNYIGQASIFKVHVFTTALAWLLFPFQIWADFRKASYFRHKIIGYVAMSLLAVGMVTSLFLAREARKVEEVGGFTSEVGFYGMAFATSLCATMGMIKILQKDRDIEQHRQWMVRAYGCMWGSFFWFRIAMVVFLPLMPTRYPHVLGLISNLSWMSGWMGADIALSLSGGPNSKQKNKQK